MRRLRGHAVRAGRGEEDERETEDRQHPRGQRLPESACPNAFSPNGDGRNDEWKVSYQSIVSFECHIFNRWGQKMCSFTNPADGWDGKYKGKTVPTGVYFYVIKAKGADGKDYKLSGDINILQKGRSTGTTGGEGGGGETPAE